MTKPPLNPETLQGKIVNSVVELIEIKKRPVATWEISKYLLSRGIKTTPNLLSAVLGQELRKQSKRLTRISRGVYGEV